MTPAQLCQNIYLMVFD